MQQGYLFALFGVFLNCIAQSFLKAGTNQVGSVSASLESALKVLTTPVFYGGFLCYGLSIVVWIMALSKLPVSVAYPLLSLAYLANTFLAYYFFQEPITMNKLLGNALIIAGVYLVAKS